MPQTIEDFKKEISGNDIFLIGGGTSFDPEKYIPLLPKSKTICINSALYDFESCLAVMFFDSTWMNKNVDLLKQKKHKYAIKFDKKIKRLETTESYDYLSIRNNGIKTFDVKLEKYDVCGNNTGVCAIHLLDILKAKTIYLLGFDCRSDDNKSHYHDRYKSFTKQKSFDRTFLPSFEKLAKNIKNADVVNLSYNSNIKCFRKAKAENILNYIEDNDSHIDK